MTTIDIISDFVCPWCYIGKRHLDALRAEADLETHWHPYFLNPEVPSGGVDRAAMMIAKFGSIERARELGRGVEDAAREAGLFLDLSVVKRVPNTADAHRLMRWASGQGRGDALAESLFAAHFADGRDIGDAETLADLAAAAGLDRPLVAELLAGDADREAVQAQADHARATGISGVPTMVFNRAVAVVGAQPVDKLRRVMAQLPGG
jgi:predicted DsbA family dithiol-disulfide isomerase